MAFPDKGLYYEDGRRRLKTYVSAKTNPNMREALLDDVAIAEGNGARKELESELSFSGRAFSGAGTKQIGWGEPRSCKRDKSFQNLGKGHFRKVYN